MGNQCVCGIACYQSLMAYQFVNFTPTRLDDPAFITYMESTNPPLKPPMISTLILKGYAGIPGSSIVSQFGYAANQASFMGNTISNSDTTNRYTLSYVTVTGACSDTGATKLYIGPFFYDATSHPPAPPSVTSAVNQRLSAAISNYFSLQNWGGFFEAAINKLATDYDAVYTLGFDTTLQAYFGVVALKNYNTAFAFGVSFYSPTYGNFAFIHPSSNVPNVATVLDVAPITIPGIFIDYSGLNITSYVAPSSCPTGQCVPYGSQPASMTLGVMGATGVNNQIMPCSGNVSIMSPDPLQKVLQSFCE